MSAEIATLRDGTEALVVNKGIDGGIEVIDLGVLASYMELLGESDPSQTVLLIRQALKPENPVDWGAIYVDLRGALSELVDAGTPTEFLVDAVDAAGKGQNVPGRDKMVAARARQQSVRTKLGRPTGKDATTNEFSGLLQGKVDAITNARAQFLGSIAPPEPRPRRTPPQAKPLFE